MKLPFFSRRVRFFGNVAIMILCAVIFSVPFAFRGARMSVNSVRNDVADWLPSDFPETEELDWFRNHFLGAQFVVISWPGCNADDPRYQELVDLLRAESLETQHEGEAIFAHEWGDRLKLQTTGDYHEDWGSHREKWLLGGDEKWYFIERDGVLREWNGESNLFGWVKRGTERLLHGKNRAEGSFRAQFGSAEDNIYYENPELLCGRFFESVMTGPDLVEQLAGPEGSLLRSSIENNEAAALDARILAHQRLTGIVFGETPVPGFDWTEESFWEVIPAKTRDALPERWRLVFNDYIERIIEEKFDGDRENLLNATRDEKLEYWIRLFDQLRTEPPARQTSIVVTLNSEVVDDLSRAVGRTIIGKPKGRILYLATDVCDIPAEELHLGGPPVDNVAIDEEGTITLIRLVSLSVFVGVTLAFISFRSLNVTFMVFFIGSISAVASMGIVWYCNDRPDAVLMSMPALVYVLGLSGAVHIVNYYREACHANGPRGAVETAVRAGWFPCTLAAFTTSLGLISLYNSNLIPIKKFGLYSALGTMATVLLLFTYLPAALQIWPPGYKKQTNKHPKEGGLHSLIGRIWERIGEAIIRRHWIVATLSLLVMITVGIGVFKIETSVHLLKLFDKDAKVITDYRWLEANLGRLVPMELVVRFDESALATTRYGGEAETDDSIEQAWKQHRRYSLLERMELSARIRAAVEETFGDQGAAIVGHGLSTDVLVLPREIDARNTPLDRERETTTVAFERNYRELLQTDTLRVDPNNGEELWRISLRVGAFNDVDYGEFVNDLKRVVEPILAAYRARNRILATIEAVYPDDLQQGSILLLGWSDPDLVIAQGGTAPVADTKLTSIDNMLVQVDQTALFSKTLMELLQNRGFVNRGRNRDVRVIVPELDSFREYLAQEEAFLDQVEDFDCVVMIRDHELYDIEKVRARSQQFVDVSNHQFTLEADNGLASSLSANDIRKDDSHEENEVADVSVVYTGIVPIVYKAQNTLLGSLINSICLAFVMIAIVMMILLRDWKSRVSARNLLNIRGGLTSMLPNVFPVVVVFGAMGHLGIKVDIGSMMTASVAMGIAVDDTIHFMNWFRRGLRQGMSRLDSIRLAYKHVATAMTQTTMIAGLGLAVFALSTFTPTQRFGVLMLTLLVAALVGDLLFLPAILAGPLGKLFQFRQAQEESAKSKSDAGEDACEGVGETSAVSGQIESDQVSTLTPEPQPPPDRSRTDSPSPGKSQPAPASAAKKKDADRADSGLAE